MKKLLTKELVSRINNNYSAPLFGILPNPNKIFKISGRAYEVMRQLKDDAHVWSCIQSRKSGVLALDYMIVHKDNEIKEFYQKLVENLDIYRLISEILEAVLFGFQVIEIFWDVKDEKIVPTRTEAKPHEWFAFSTEGKLILNKNQDKSELPAEKTLICKHDASYINPYGSSLLSKCYWAVTFKSGGMRFWANFMEKYGMPLLIGQYTRGATQEETSQLADVLATMTEDTVIVTPSDINITMHEAARNSSVDLYREMIKQCNSEISKAILSQTLTTELEQGSFAASKTHFKVRREVILSDVRMVEASVNKLFAYVADINFPNAEVPKFKMIINDAENSETIDRDSKLMAAGIKFSSEYFQKTYGYDAGDIEEM